MCTAYVARARLVRKLTTWNSAVHREFAWECIAHGRDVVREALRRAGHLPEADLMSVATGLLDTYSWGIGSVSTELASAVGILGEAVSDLHAGQANLATYQCSLAVGAARAGGLHGETRIFDDGVHAERAWQSRWLADRLDIDDLLERP